MADQFTPVLSLVTAAVNWVVCPVAIATACGLIATLIGIGGCEDPQPDIEKTNKGTDRKKEKVHSRPQDPLLIFTLQGLSGGTLGTYITKHL